MLEQFLFIRVPERNRMKTTEKIFNAETNQETIIEREMTEQEKLEFDDFLLRKAARAEAESVAQAQRAAVLAKLGLTPEEAQALLG